MEQPPNSTEARSICEQVHAEHDVQPDPVFRHNDASSATESPEAYWLKCVEEILKIYRCERRCLVNELL